MVDCLGCPRLLMHDGDDPPCDGCERLEKVAAKVWEKKIGHLNSGQ